jgi:hypothetical protein
VLPAVVASGAYTEAATALVHADVIPTPNASFLVTPTALVHADIILAPATAATLTAIAVVHADVIPTPIAIASGVDLSVETSVDATNINLTTASDLSDYIGAVTVYYTKT